MTADEYRVYLRSPHWQSFRARYRASGLPQKCLLCDEVKYQLHHLTYERLGDERLSDVMPLCARCHRIVHHIGLTAAAIRVLSQKVNERVKQRSEPSGSPKRVQHERTWGGKGEAMTKKSAQQMLMRRANRRRAIKAQALREHVRAVDALTAEQKELLSRRYAEIASTMGLNAARREWKRMVRQMVELDPATAVGRVPGRILDQKASQDSESSSQGGTLAERTP